METLVELNKQPYDSINVEEELLYEVKKLYRRYPEYRSKLIHVLAAVDDRVDEQLEQRLQQAKNDHTGERVVLIPFHLENSHWIGLLIKFNANEQIERAEFVDPVKHSNFVPDKLQKQFKKIFSGIILKSQVCQVYGDRNKSAWLTIDNLSKAVELSEFKQSGSSNMNQSSIESTDDQQRINSLVTDQSSNWQQNDHIFYKAAFPEGNDSNYSDSCRISSTEIESLLKSPVKVPETEKSLEPLKTQKGHDESKNAIETLEGLRESPISTIKVHNLTTDASINKRNNFSISELYDTLKNQLQDGLKELDISSVKELDEQIVQKKKEIDVLKREGKYNNARKRENSLSDLKELESLMNKIKEIETTQLTNDYERLKIKLNNSLAAHEIKDEEELMKLITDKKQKIESLKNQGKHNTALKRQNSLSELEEIRSFADRINTLKFSSTNVNCTTPHQHIDDNHLNDNVIDSCQKVEVPITNESLNNMYQDWCSMPLCSEKIVINLLYLVSIKLVGDSISLDETIVRLDQIEKEIVEEYHCLKDRLKLEELTSLEIQKSIDNLWKNIKTEDWESSINVLKKIFKEISPLNMHELFRLIDKVNDTAELIKGKDIVFFLGGTGSGKSTTIHLLAGSKMIEKKVNGLNHIAPIEIKNSYLKSVKTAPFAKSVTQYITSVIIKPEDVGLYTGDNIILCDSPGFDDTRGPEIDIANGIGIVTAIRGCKSVKPVVLISYKSSGDRFEGLKNLTHLLSGLIPGIQQQMIAFSYIFTKYPEKERDTIHASLEHIFKTMDEKEKSDIGFKNILTDMLYKTENGARILDPIKSNPKEILRELITSKSIHRPDETFQFTITKTSKDTIYEQLRKYQSCIRLAIKHFEYSLIKYKLDQLKQLKDLLDQEYIKQTYIDCIRDISTHLSQEYENGTSILNRCLMSQTILTKKDSKQYKIYIDHANLAEELKNQHLKEQFIHSSAFIQYLNHQLDQMKIDLNHQLDEMQVDLKKKHIKDLSIKMNLDKLKLLSEDFYHVNDRYEEMRQLFIKKIDSIINSFQDSFISQDFDNSAIILTILSDTLHILHDHFNYEDIETKYLKLKTDFRNYLTNSVSNLNNIFQKSTLEEIDIQNLNECVCMFEKAMNTFILHVHISKEDINEIYEDFISKIICYFENIIKEIEREFQNENSQFYKLEQFLQQLDLIRTISKIKLNTAQQYYSTIEKLVRHIYESRRDAEVLLGVFFRREGTIDYNKLTKCLSNLKNAHWIEKYRSGIYSDVINTVEHQIIRHTEELKKIIMEFNLDLENSDKIEYVYKIVSEINEIKYLKDFISPIDQHINEVNLRFQKVTNKVFDIIKETFNLEEWKKQEYKTFDSNKAEKALCYLEICKKIPDLVENDCMSIHNSLEIFLKTNNDFIQKEMTNNFEMIKQCQKECKNDMTEKALILSYRLDEISEMEINKYSRVLYFFSKITTLKYWKNELSNYLLELLGEMAGLNVTESTEALDTKLSIAKALSKLDKFLEGEKKYIDIYYQYQKIFFSQNNDVGQQVISAIKNYDYEGVAVKMMTLQTSTEVGKHFYKEAKRPLNTGLNQLMQRTRNQVNMLGRTIEIEEIKSIVENLKRIEAAKQYVADHLDAPDKIDDYIKEVQRLIEDRIKFFLEGVQALINNHNFYEADKKIDSIPAIRNSLENYCTKDISDQIEKLNEYHNDFILTNVVEKYSNMDINGYTLNPPTDIFEKFGKVNNTNPIYNRALNTIKEKIYTKFREELDKAKSKQPPNVENTHIRRFESAVKYLPEAMRSALEVELRHCKEDIGQLIRDNENKLDFAFSSGDVRNIKGILLEYQKSQDLQSFANTVKELVLKEIREIVSKVNQNFEQYEIREAFINVMKLYTYKVELEEILSDIKRPYSEVRLRIIKVFDDAYLFFVNRFLNSNISMIANESAPAVEKSFTCLTEFMKFKDDHNDQQMLNHILPEDFNEKIDILIKKIQDEISEYKTKYENALEKLDIDSLVNILEIISKWNYLFTKIKIYYDTYSKRDTLMDTMITSLKELIPPAQILQLISRKIEELGIELIHQDFLNNDTRQFSKNRDEFYRKLNEKFSILGRAKIFSQYNIQIDINRIEQDCLASLDTKIKTICQNLEKLLGKFSKENTLIRKEFDNFNLYYCNLISITQEIKVTHYDIKLYIENIQEKTFDKIQTFERSIENDSKLSNIVMNLKNMKRIANNIPAFKSKVNERIDEMLKYYKNSNGVKALAQLGTILNQDSEGIGQAIISEHKLFQGYSLSLFNVKTQTHGIDHVLHELRGDFLEKNLLKKRYKEFHSIYRKIVQENLSPDMKLDKLVSDTKLSAGNIIQKDDAIVWNPDIGYQIPILVAHIFALWTLQNADHYFEAESLNDKNNYLLQPHAAQVISIFRMLGIGDLEEKLINNLVQIGTGEGKSITLGVTASLLALLGFDVYCACYSEYLSHRDYSAFLSLFDSLGVLNYIHYGTFNKLCEDMINEDGDIRELVGRLISNNIKDAMKVNRKIKRAKILLIDEVDVFFSREFYGNVYTPSVSLKDPTITSLVNYIWTQRKSNLNLKKILVTPEYKACSQRYTNWELLILEAVKDMLSDVYTFESHDYVVNQDKIGYIEQDNIVYNIVYGYKTLFAYHCEYEKGNISRESLHENISIKINCGNFSYADIPLQFKYIMGVTGTLETLSEPERKVIKNDYNVIKRTYVSSVFGKNNLRFMEKDDIMIENNADYFNRIRTEIDDRLIGKNSEKRAVLVFFESKQKLIEFYNSDALASIKESVVYLTEEASLEEKENLIKRATISGQITLFTRTYGRGTDFICHDQFVAINGGTHIIQTFLSDESSEEKQIKGRTARQGDQGSYSMILLDHDLEKFHIEKKHIEDIRKGRGFTGRISDTFRITKTYSTIYELLHDKRTQLFKIQYAANRKYVEQAKEKHKISQQFLSSLHYRDIDSIRKFLLEENKGAESHLYSRTVCLMDATSSMYHLLNKCKNTVDAMFERASDILKGHKINSDSFQLQFAVYRNYNSREDKILQSSPWETKPLNLRTFMNKIGVEGGWHNEAIEIGLWHANIENNREHITQVILIGDAPPNAQDNVTIKRNHFGLEYWKKTKFAEETYYENELAKLISDKIPVHAFYVDLRAKEKFEEIANRTGGRCELLDINSNLGSDMLTDLVTEEILNNIGGKSKGEVLVQAYRNKFGKSYSNSKKSTPSEEPLCNFTDVTDSLLEVPQKKNVDETTQEANGNISHFQKYFEPSKDKN